MEEEEIAAVKKCILCLLLALALSVNAFAMEIPTDTVVQNLNGSQQLIICSLGWSMPAICNNLEWPALQHGMENRPLSTQKYSL